MKNSRIQNQSYLRKINQSTILNHLRKEKLSCADLAKIMGLSNTAIANITDELVKYGVLIKKESSAHDVGRRPILLEINPECARIAVIELASRDIIYGIYSLNGNKIAEDKIVIEDKITAETLQTTATKLLELYRSTKDDIPLKALCISTPGKIDNETGNFLLAHRFEDYKDINLKTLFSKYFDCEISIVNDIKLALYGERSYGKHLDNIKNAMMLHIDYSVGSALMLNRSIYNGTRGFAGEITNFTIDNATGRYDIFKSNTKNSLQNLSVDNLIFYVKSSILQGDNSLLNTICPEVKNIKLNHILKAYRLNDSLVSGMIKSYAGTWANIIKSLSEFLDLEAVVLSGDVVKLGNAFKDELETKINKNLKYSDLDIMYSKLGERASLLGGIYTAQSLAIETLLSEIK